MGNKLDCQQIGLEYGVKLDSKKQTILEGHLTPLHPLYIACGSHFLCIILYPLCVVLMLARVICILKMVPTHN